MEVWRKANDIVFTQMQSQDFEKFSDMTVKKVNLKEE